MGPMALARTAEFRQHPRMAAADPVQPGPGQTPVELTERECWEHLRDEAYGRLAVVDDDGPVIYPINVLVDHGTLVFRTTEGAKLDAVRADDRVSFEVDGFDTDTRLAWSVVIRGRGREVTNPQEGADVTELGVTPWQAGPKPTFVRITPRSVTGRTFARSDAPAGC